MRCFSRIFCIQGHRESCSERDLVLYGQFYHLLLLLTSVHFIVETQEEINWHRNDANAGTVPMIASGRSLKPVEIPASKLRRTKFSLNFPPSSFHLLHTTGLPQSANSGCVRLQDVIEVSHNNTMHHCLYIIHDTFRGIWLMLRNESSSSDLNCHTTY